MNKQSISALLSGMASLLSIFYIWEKPEPRDANYDAEMIANDWKQVGKDIASAMAQYEKEYGRK